MSYLPDDLIASLKDVAGFDEKLFVQIHDSGEQVTSIRFNQKKFDRIFQYKTAYEKTFSGLKLSGKIPWSDNGFYLRKRPSFYLDPLWHAGAYYVQEPSSMCLEFVLKNLCDLTKPLRVLDLCAAPGGKSTLMAGLLSEDSLLVSNEVISSRVSVLKENILKWGIPNIVITQNDASDFGKLTGYFDVILVDAPCSGSGLFRKDPDAVKEWSSANVQLCSRRQRRILSDVLPSLKSNGLLIYTTCSFSPEEDEDICDYLVREFQLKDLPLSFKSAWNIVESSSPVSGSYGYRFYPDKLAGEGFFLACFQNESREEGDSKEKIRGGKKKMNFSEMDKKLCPVIEPWVDKVSPFHFVEMSNYLTAIPINSMQEIKGVFAPFKIIYAGLRLGKVIRNQLIPEHALALSIHYGENIPTINLEEEDTIRFLRKESFIIRDGLRGWTLISYRNYNIGWIKGMGNRFNNYYPVNWRIRKQ